MIVIVTTVVTVPVIITMMIRPVVEAIRTVVAMVADDAAAERNDGRQKHGSEENAFHWGTPR